MDEEDERFKNIKKDPRFKRLNVKKKKVKIDERFNAMFKDKKFASSSDDLKRYYMQDKESDDEEDGDDDDEVEDEEQGVLVSSSSDESESESEEEKSFTEEEADKIDQPTRRIAVQNFDWTQMSADDIFIIFNSVRPPLSVTMYVSEFGKERLKREEAEGPPELVDMPVIDEDEAEYDDVKSKMQSFKTKKKVDEDEDAEGVSAEVKKQIRRYELNKLKYYYAVIEFDCVESAQVCYKELDGIEYEGSSIELDLRYIPDDMEFDERDIKSTCTKLPDVVSYKAPQFISTAKQQTKVDFTWDTDKKRQDKLLKAYTKEDLEKRDLQAYLASDDESEDEEENNQKASKYAELVASLTTEEEKKKAEKTEVTIDFGDGEASSGNKSSGKKRRKKKDSDEDDDSESEVDEGLALMVDEESRKANFKFDPNDDRFSAIYKNRHFNIDPSHPKFKQTEAFKEVANNKRRKRRVPS